MPSNGATILNNMIEIGQYSSLTVVKKVDFGYYLDAGPYGEVLLPNNTAPEDLAPEDELEVFLYCDSDDRVIATTARPYGVANSFACLEVKDLGSIGAFMDWGLSKDLLIPFREQPVRMEEGKSYVVRIYVDEHSERLVGSARLGRFLEDTGEELEEGQEVEIMVVKQTDLGWKVIVDDHYWGLVFHDEIFKPLQVGDQQKAYIKQIREDGKLNIALQKQGYEHIEGAAKLILNQLQAKGGFLELTDKSDPEQIKNQLQMSKKAFKKAIGNLYRQRLIVMEPEGIRLNK